MTTALFIGVNSAAVRSEDVANLGALAETALKAGLSPQTLILDLDDAADLPAGLPATLGPIRRLCLPAGSGDGATCIDAVLAPIVADANPALIVAASDIASRNWGARLAAALSATFLPACDGLAVEGGYLQANEPVMGGMMRRQVVLAGQNAVVLYAGEDLDFGGAMSPVPGMADCATVEAAGMKLVGRQSLPDVGGIPLKGAACVVSGGLGVGSAENWSRIDGFARRVGAAVGASRAAVDMGWVPSSRQVGFSGQKVSPDVYVAIGISGAVHHLAGIGGARKVVAVNKDPEAPIFQIADVAIIGDYQAILEAAHRKLDQA